MSTLNFHRKNPDCRGSAVTDDACSYKQVREQVREQCRSQGGTLNNLRSNAGIVPGQYIVPNYEAIGYDALTHGNAGGGCNNYFNIEQAYGSGAGSCSTSYSVRACGGCAGQQVAAPAARNLLQNRRQRNW